MNTNGVATSLSRTEARPGKAYQYQPLELDDMIRLLRVEAGHRFNDIKCTMEVHRLATMPAFEALSYTWGNPQDRKIIKVAEKKANMSWFPKSSRHISVTANCESALRRLRRRTSSRLLWVDAICIDQSNPIERNQQVAIMHLIYRTARSVVVDLGLPSSQSDFAIDILSTTGDSYPYTGEYQRRITSAFVELFSRPWFSRVWVLQEIFMSQNAVVLYGESEVGWEIIRPLSFKSLSEDNEVVSLGTRIPDPIPYALEVGNHQSKTYRGVEGLLDLLCQTRHCFATDPRDKVFALFSILSDADEQGLAADYTKETSQVYEEIACYLLQQYGYRLLSCVHGPSKLKGLPSWVPDWSINGGFGMFSLDSVCERSSAGGEKMATGPSIIKSPSATTLLATQGMVFSRILVQETIITDYKDEEASIERLYHKTMAINPEFHFPTSIAKGPRGDLWFDRMLQTRLASKDYWTRTIAAVWQRMTFTGKGRRLFLTSNGYLGLGPKDAKVDDVVCIFSGAEVPYILRAGSNSEVDHRYNLVGECYVYGIMAGEAISDSESNFEEIFIE